MTKQTQRQKAHRIPDHFPCPQCQRIVQVGDKFCGFCKQPLSIQCPECGNWTKAQHRACPQCATLLHEGGRTFAENQKLSRMRQALREATAAYAMSEQRLSDLILERNSAAIRLLVVVLVSVVLFAFGAPVVAFLNALGVWGVIVVIVALVAFGAIAIVIVSAYIRLCQWGSIGVVIEIQKEISKAQAYLKDLGVERAELDEAITFLRTKGTRQTSRYADLRQFREEDEEWCRDLEDLRDWMGEEEEEQQPVGRPNGSAEIQPSSEAFASPARPVTASDKDAVPNANVQEDVIEALVVELSAEEDEEVGKKPEEEELGDQDQAAAGKRQDEVEEQPEEEDPVAQDQAALVTARHRGGKGGRKGKPSRKKRFPR